MFGVEIKGEKLGKEKSQTSIWFSSVTATDDMPSKYQSPDQGITPFYLKSVKSSLRSRLSVQMGALAAVSLFFLKGRLARAFTPNAEKE